MRRPGRRSRWWEARAQYLRAIQETYAAIEARGRQAVQAKADAARGLVPRVPPRHSEPETFMAEPTADESAQWEADLARMWQDEDAEEYVTVPEEE